MRLGQRLKQSDYMRMRARRSAKARMGRTEEDGTASGQQREDRAAINCLSGRIPTRPEIAAAKGSTDVDHDANRLRSGVLRSSAPLGCSQTRTGQNCRRGGLITHRRLLRHDQGTGRGLPRKIGCRGTPGIAPDIAPFQKLTVAGLELFTHNGMACVSGSRSRNCCSNSCSAVT